MHVVCKHMGRSQCRGAKNIDQQKSSSLIIPPDYFVKSPRPYIDLIDLWVSEKHLTALINL